MTKMKYVILKNPISKLGQPYIFSECIKHSEFICNMNISMEDIISAGFCFVKSVPDAPSIVTGPNDSHLEWSCYGRSGTLGIGSNPEDNKVLNTILDLNS